MTVSTTNVETVRDEIASFLATALVGTGLPCQAVYGYAKKDFGGQSPVVLVISGGDDFRLEAVNTRVKGSIYLQVLSFVLYQDTAASWTEADCEDRINLVKKTILDAIFNNQFTSTRQIFIDGRSTIRPANVGGADYQMETINLRVDVYN